MKVDEATISGATEPGAKEVDLNTRNSEEKWKRAIPYVHIAN